MDRNQIRHKITSKYVALLSLTEAGLGSLLHALHIPLSGHFLSLNQAYLLSNAVRSHKEESQAKRVELVSVSLEISVFAALFKSLSPAGKKLTPMIAISIQGALFSLGVLAFGSTPIALATSMSMLALWAFAQPLLFAWLIFGQEFFEAFFWGLDKLSEQLSLPLDWGLWIYAACVLIKLSIAFSLGLFSKSKKLERLSSSLSQSGKKILLKKSTTSHTQQHPFKGALKDLFSPLMLLSFFLMTVFFVFSTALTPTQEVWTMLRALCVGLVLFYLIRAFPLKRVALKIENKHPRLASIMNAVESEISSDHDDPKSERQY